MKYFTFNFIKEIPLKFKNWNRLQFYKRNPFKIFCLQFYMKIPLKIILTFQKSREFYKRNPFKFFFRKKLSSNFPKFQPQNWQVRHHFFKNSLQEGVFENSWKFLQLVQTFTPITNLLCTFSSCSDLSIYLNYNIYKFHQIWRTKNGFTFHFTFTFTFTFTSLHFHFTFTSLSQLTLKSRTSYLANDD